MNSLLLNRDWNADPNAPEVEVTVQDNTLVLDFFVNYFLFDKFNEGDRARIIFYKCHKYSYNSMNDQGYYSGQYRYTNNQLPWGGFYQLETKWEIDFPVIHSVLIANPNQGKPKHYIFFFRDNTFECVAEGYQLKFYKNEYP